MDDSTFRVVLRGYEPAQVNRRIEELTAAVAQATAQRDTMAARLEQAQRQTADAAPVVAPTPTYEELGARIGQMLALAAEEADELRQTAQAEVAAARLQVAEETAKLREEADRYAADIRSTAETEATRIVETARRAADERLDNAERDATARIQEAEALHDEQRAKAVQSAADFENTLAARRKAAEEEFRRQMDEVERRLAEARQTLEAARSEAQTAEADARLRSRTLVEEAEAQAQSIVHEAQTAAARLRAESDRELAAATQRRDAINAQLGNVRQMLTTLSGSVSPHAAAAAEALDPVAGEGVEESPDGVERTTDAEVSAPESSDPGHRS